MEDVDSSLERIHDFAIISSKFIQGSGLLLENVHDRVDRMAIFELPGEGVVDQSHPCLFLIALQGSIKKHLKHATHYTMEGTSIEVESVLCEGGMDKGRGEDGSRQQQAQYERAQPPHIDAEYCSF